MNTKKALIYGGSALVLGAVAFFVWSFFQKPIIPIGNSTIILGNEDKKDEEPLKSDTNAFSTPTVFEPIKTPNINSDLDLLIHGSNP